MSQWRVISVETRTKNEIFWTFLIGYGTVMDDSCLQVSIQWCQEQEPSEMD